jgi:hypothetical protein
MLGIAQGCASVFNLSDDGELVVQGLSLGHITWRAKRFEEVSRPAAEADQATYRQGTIRNVQVLQEAFGRSRAWRTSRVGHSRPSLLRGPYILGELPGSYNLLLERDLLGQRHFKFRRAQSLGKTWRLILWTASSAPIGPVVYGEK